MRTPAPSTPNSQEVGGSPLKFLVDTVQSKALQWFAGWNLKQNSI